MEAQLGLGSGAFRGGLLPALCSAQGAGMRDGVRTELELSECPR